MPGAGKDRIGAPLFWAETQVPASERIAHVAGEKRDTQVVEKGHFAQDAPASGNVYAGERSRGGLDKSVVGDVP